MQYLHGNGSWDFATFFLLAIRDAPSSAAARIWSEIRRSSQWHSTSACTASRVGETHRKSFLGRSKLRDVHVTTKYILNPVVLFMRGKAELPCGLFDSDFLYGHFRRKNARADQHRDRKSGKENSLRDDDNGKYLEKPIVVPLLRESIVVGALFLHAKSRVIDGIATVYCSFALPAERNSERGNRNYIYLYDAISLEKKIAKIDCSKHTFRKRCTRTQCTFSSFS